MSKNIKITKQVRMKTGKTNALSCVTKNLLKSSWVTATDKALNMALQRGFNFTFRAKDDEFDCLGILAVASWLVEPRIKGSEDSYIASSMAAVFASACKALEGYKLVKTSTVNGDDLIIDLVRKVGERYNLNDEKEIWAETFALIATRFRFPLYTTDNFDDIASALMEMKTSILEKRSYCDIRVLELFSQKTVACVHKFVTACINGDDAYDVQKYLNDGAFAIMNLPEEADRHLAKEGRQFMRFVAACLYKIYSQNKDLQYDFVFESVNFKELLPKVQVGRVEWTYGFYTKQFDYNDSRFAALFVLLPERGITFTVKESKVKAGAHWARMHHAIHSYFNRVCDFFIKNCVSSYINSYWKEIQNDLSEEVKVELKKKIADLDTANKQVKQLKNENRVNQKQINSLEMQVKTLQSQKENLTAELREVKASDVIKQKDSVIQQMHIDMSELEKVNQSLESKLSAAQTRIKSLESRKTQKGISEEEIRILREQVSSLQEALDNCIVEETGVSMEDISNFCRKVKPFVIGGVKGFEKTLDKVFAEYSYFDIADSDCHVVVPDSVDCAIAYTRVIGHGHVENVKSQLPPHIPFIPLDFSNADLIRKTVYNALNSRD